ncbi:unnamed protein product, partial [Larinioides sclopetarius]
PSQCQHIQDSALRETKCKVGFLPVNTVGKMVKTWQILLASVHLLEGMPRNQPRKSNRKTMAHEVIKYAVNSVEFSSTKHCHNYQAVKYTRPDVLTSTLCHF